METLEYLAYAGMLVSVFTIDWKDKKTNKIAFMTLVLIASGVGLMFLIFGK